MATKKEAHEAVYPAQVKLADPEKVRAASKKVRARDKELLRRLAK